MTGLTERLAGPLRGARRRVHDWPGGELAWRLGVAVVGTVLVVGGLVLVPLPGPGWLIVFLGLAVWGTEFAWADRLQRWTRAKVSAGTDWIAAQPRWLRVLGSVVTVVVLVGAAVAYLAWKGWWPFN